MHRVWMDTYTQNIWVYTLVFVNGYIKGIHLWLYMIFIYTCKSIYSKKHGKVNTPPPDFCRNKNQRSLIYIYSGPATCSRSSCIVRLLPDSTSHTTNTTTSPTNVANTTNTTGSSLIASLINITATPAI